MFEKSLSEMDDEAFFRTLATSIEELRVKVEAVACVGANMDH